MMYFECTAAAGGRASQGSGGKSEVAGGCWLWPVQRQPAIVMLSMASLVGRGGCSWIASAADESVGGGR